MNLDLCALSFLLKAFTLIRNGQELNQKIFNMNSLILSIQANGENIIIGDNETVKTYLDNIIEKVARQVDYSMKYHLALKRARTDLKPIMTPYLKVRLNPDGDMFIKPFKTLEDVAIEISLTLSEI